MSKLKSRSINTSNTELSADELSQHTPVKRQSNSNKYSYIYSRKQMTPKSASSINKYRHTMRQKDQQTAELMISAKIASDKNREILYSSTMKPLSPNTIMRQQEQRLNSYYPSTEADTSSIKGFESHVLRMRTPPKKEKISSPSFRVIIPSQCPNLTPSRQEKDRLIREIDSVLEEIENDA